MDPAGVGDVGSGSPGQLCPRWSGVRPAATTSWKIRVIASTLVSSDSGPSGSWCRTPLDSPRPSMAVRAGAAQIGRTAGQRRLKDI